MYDKVFLLILPIIFSAIPNTKPLGISGKLDFGDTPSIRTQETQYKVLNGPVHYKTIKTIETKNNDDFGQIGVVCVSGGCNTTKTKDSSNDSIQTDVVVHVQTKVDLNQNSKLKVIDDTPDVPVVVGFAGSKLDSTIEEGSDQGRSMNPQTIVVPNVDPVLNSFSASLNPFVPSTSITLDPPPIRSRIDTSLDTSFNPQEAIYLPAAEAKTDTDFDIKIKTIPSVTLTMSEGGKNLIKDVRYKTNGLELHVPYFEPSFNKHYFGEHPPPQFVWYPKKTSSFNPVEFRNIPKSTWNPSTWNTRTPTYHKHSTNGPICACKNQGSSPGLSWYPSNNRRIGNNDPGSQINDKLAPLN